MQTNAKNPMLPELFTVEEHSQDTHDTFTLTLKTQEGKSGMEFAPGQFNMLYAFGAGEAPISISGDPADDTKLIHTIRSVGSVTAALSRLSVGDTVGVRGPFGSSWPVEEAQGKDVLLITGGIGLAPLRPVIYHLLANRQNYGKIALLYGARSPGDILYQNQLDEWSSHPDLQVRVTVDHADPDWHGNVGVVTLLLPKVNFDPQNTLVMTCGPEIMMYYSVRDLLSLGLDTDSIHVSMERNMKCGIGLCGHCQYGPEFICSQGPVFPYSRISHLFKEQEV